MALPASVNGQRSSKTFLDFPAEIRNRIYELATNVKLYAPQIKPAESELQAHKHQLVYLAGRVQLQTGKAQPVVPRTYQLLCVNQGPILAGCQFPAKPTPLPGILGVNQQISHESLAIFYHVNTITFHNCNITGVARWIFKVVGKHKFHLRKVIWQEGRDHHITRKDAMALGMLYTLIEAGLLKEKTLCFWPGIGSRSALSDTTNPFGELRSFIKSMVWDEKSSAAELSKEEVNEISHEDLEAMLNEPVSQWWTEHGGEEDKVIEESTVSYKRMY